MEEIIVRNVRLGKVKGAVVEDEEGDYNIYINPDYTLEQQRKTLKHELRHIRSGHLRGKKSARSCEDEIKRNPCG